MAGRYKNLTYIYFAMNIVIFASMAVVYYFYNIPNFVIYCGISFLLMCLDLIFHKRIPELFTLVFLLVNLDLYALFFSVTTGASAGIELYPLVLIGVCYLLTYGFILAQLLLLYYRTILLLPSFPLQSPLRLHYVPANCLRQF